MDPEQIKECYCFYKTTDGESEKETLARGNYSGLTRAGSHAGDAVRGLTGVGRSEQELKALDARGPQTRAGWPCLERA